uniref:Uncharacterized protein n=1 Tax=Zea mays TaxID=4577 RepID=C4JAV2_MAIZE|nr:unknown [Zea mays]
MILGSAAVSSSLRLSRFLRARSGRARRLGAVAERDRRPRTTGVELQQRRLAWARGGESGTSMARAKSLAARTGHLISNQSVAARVLSCSGRRVFLVSQHL